MNTNALLREGRTLEPRYFGRAEALSELGVCTTRRWTYVLCVSEQDEDYPAVRTSGCDAKIRIEDEDETVTCPECYRTVYLDQKEMHESMTLSLDESGCRSFVRELAKGATGASFTKRSNSLSYLDYPIEQVNTGQVGGDTVMLPIVSERVPEASLQSARVVNDSLVWVLVGEGLGLRGVLEDLDFEFVALGDLIDVDKSRAEEILAEQIDKTATHSLESYLDVAGQAALELCSSRETLVPMGWAEFEHCVHTLLMTAFGTSYLLGETQRGSGEPDGALTLHWSDDSLFMWDAKFVDLANNSETELRGEYDKIFRHLRRMDEQERYQRDFDGVAGILLFTPGIKDANVKRLAETIHSREISNPKKWGGSIVYFELDALIELANGVRRDHGAVRSKPNLFRKAMHANLTSPSKHQDDPEDVHSTDYTSLHMGVDDIREIFEFVGRQSTEHTEFNREEYLREANYFNDI